LKEPAASKGLIAEIPIITAVISIPELFHEKSRVLEGPLLINRSVKSQSLTTSKTQHAMGI
jgi:hypothetical protein